MGRSAAPVFYRSALIACPYIEGQVERRVVTELVPELVDAGLFESLTIAGFRRSHSYAYRPMCPSCSACVPVRILVDKFRPRRSLSRTWRANADLDAASRPAIATREGFDLFQRYQLSRHGDGDMASMDFGDYRALVEDGVAETRLVELRDPQGALVGVCLYDVLAGALSAVYSFFEPTLPARGLGSHLVLWLVEEARRTRRAHVYLGYWIEQCRKMAYKIRFQPIEVLGPGGWRPFEPPATSAAGRP